jgi:HK97 gp10 family phage protein
MPASSLLSGTSIPRGKIDLFPKSSGFNRRKARGSFSRTTFEVQGLNVLTEHWYTVAVLTDQLAFAAVDFYSDIVIHNARQFVPKDTWATHDSINKDPGVVRSAIGDYSAWIGPTTFYSRFLEFGTIKMSPRPFMIPAVDMIEKDFIRTFEQIARIPDQITPRVMLSGGFGRDRRARSPISSLRSGLYSISKFLGDISVFGGREFLSPIRSFAITGARLLGDVDATMRGRIGARFSHRLRGRAVGRLSGFGTASLTASKAYSGSFTGGHRIYNRLVGRLSAPVVSTRLPGLGG